MIKKVIKKLAKSKNIPTFAVLYNHTGVRHANNRTAFFYARSLNYSGSIPPCFSVMEKLPVWCRATGKVEPFFYSQPSQFQTNIFKMLYLKNIVCVGWLYPTNTHGKGEILHSFTKATAFIFLLVLSFMLHTCTAGRVALSHFQNGSL